MGKNKKGGAGPKRAFKKDPVATRVATGGVKKTKTKAVTSNVKRINFQVKANTDAVDAQFAKLQQQGKTTTTTTKAAASKVFPGAAKAEAERAVKVKASSKSTKRSELDEETDVTMATDDFSKLASV